MKPLRFLSLLIVTSLVCAGSASAATKPFATAAKVKATTKSLKWKINKPKVAKKHVLDLIQLRGCWLSEGLKSIKVTNKKGKKVKFSKNKSNGSIELKGLKDADFPLTVLSSFTGAREVVKFNSSVVAQSVASCTKLKKSPCAVAAPLKSKNTLDGVYCDNPSDFAESSSAAKVVLGDGDETGFFPTSAKLSFAVQGESFLPDLADATVTVGTKAFLAPEIALAGPLLALQQTSLIDGVQEVTVTAKDSKNQQLSGTFKIWAGASTLTVNVVDAANQPAGPGSVKLELGDDKSVTQTVPLTGGQAIFRNVPGRTIALTATTAKGETGFVATTGNAGTVSVPVVGVGAPSATANNDFSQGAAGWTVGSSPVQVVQHVEEVGISASPQGAPDQDLQLNTSGEGAQYMSRTFTVSPGTKALIVRYRFVTSEFPGGYFGTRYNDYFNLAIRTLKGGGSINDGNSMNALGKGAFSTGGSTAWRIVRLPVEKAGDTIQIDVAVANVADGAFGSSVIIDYVKESKFGITKHSVNDLDGDTLLGLSADAHTYFEKFTHIWGTIKVEGNEKDGLKDLELQILESAKVVATAKLSTQANKKIIKKFGKAGFVQIKDPMLLFKLFPNDAAGLDSETDKDFQLRIRAYSMNGEVDDADAGKVEQLVQYDVNARYGKRDEDQGGDDWVKPSHRITARALQVQGVVIGDISNMNGGKFPPHDEHTLGADADGWVTGYNARNEATARRLIELLNTPVGRKIGRMLVRFNRSDTNPFWRTIKNYKLDDNRIADRVILPHDDHDTHFHMNLR